MVNTVTPISRFILFLFFLQPVLFNPRGDDVFHLTKNTFFLVMLMLLFLVWLVRRFENKELFSFLKSALPLPLLFFILSSVCSYVFSIHRATSMNECILTCAYFLWFLLFVHFIREKDDIAGVLCVLSYSVFCSSFYGMFQHFGVDFVHWSDASVRFRPSSTQGNPDFFGAFLAVSFPYVLYFVLKISGEQPSPLKSKPGMTLFLLLTLWLAFMGIIFTLARASWLAFIGSMIVFLLLVPASVYRKSWRLLLFIFLILGLTLGGITFAAKTKDKKTGHGGETAVNISDRLNIGSSGRIRLILWGDTLHLIRRAPFFGYGLSTYPLVYPRHRSVDILRIQAITALPEDAHNEFLQRATTTGIAGLFCYLWLIVFAVMKMVNMRKSNPLFPALLLSSFSGYHIQSFFNPRVPDISLLFWTTLAVLFSSYAQEQKPGTRPLGMPLSNSSKILRAAFSFSLCVLIGLSALPKIMWPFLADIQYHKGELLLQTNQFDKASLQFAYAVELDKSCLKCARELALCYKRVGEITGNEKIMLMSVKEYEKLLPQMPYDGSLFADAGRAYLVLANKRKKYFQPAVKLLKRASALDPNYPIFHNDLGIAYLNSGKYKEAEKQFYKAEELVPGFFDPYLNLGVLYFRMKKLPLAIQSARKAISIEPSSAEAHANLAVFLHDSDRKKEAVKYAELAVTLSQGNRRYLSLLEKISGKGVSFKK